MSEKLRASNIETLVTPGSRDFLAKYTFFTKIFPHVFDTEHGSTIVECFNDPVSAPRRMGDGIEPVIPREWPTDAAELLSELDGRVKSLQSRITSMNAEKTRQSFSEPKPERDPEDVREVEEFLNRPENLNIKRDLELKKRMFQAIADYSNPEKLPEIEQKLLEAKNARIFIQNLIEEKKI